MTTVRLPDLAQVWRDRAEELKPYCAPAAEAFTRAAIELESAMRAAEEEPLTLEQAASESGYSTERLRHMIADGTLPQAGRRGAPRVRRGDLPRKQRSTSTFDPAASARRVLGAHR